MISGGQRKRLNIAWTDQGASDLFVDEPTSGFHRAIRKCNGPAPGACPEGKLIFVVHTSAFSEFTRCSINDILDTADTDILCNRGSGHVFKRLDVQIKAKRRMSTCGNVNPELIFNIIEAKVVDEFVIIPTPEVYPQQWKNITNSCHLYELNAARTVPRKNLKIPAGSATWHYNHPRLSIQDQQQQYVALSFSKRRYWVSYCLPSSVISKIRFGRIRIQVNENIPFLFSWPSSWHCFWTYISAEEIFRDRKILKREHS